MPPIERESGLYSGTRTWIPNGNINKPGGVGEGPGKSYLKDLLNVCSSTQNLDLINVTYGFRWHFCRVCSWGSLKNQGNVVTFMPGRTHNRIGCVGPCAIILRAGLPSGDLWEPFGGQPWLVFRQPGAHITTDLELVRTRGIWLSN